VVFGFVGDAAGPDHAIMVVAAVRLATLPLAWLLTPLPTEHAGAGKVARQA
jgi:hypothetical protein